MIWYCFLIGLAVIVLTIGAVLIPGVALRQRLTGTADPHPAEALIEKGMRGRALSRLAPMGKVRVEGYDFEAKSDQGYIDEATEVEVVGFENSNVIVKIWKSDM